MKKTKKSIGSTEPIKNDVLKSSEKTPPKKMENSDGIKKEKQGF